ncbi:MAG: asparagine synthase (glutamine-hydrolyzing) [Phycisphaerae bacterium]
MSAMCGFAGQFVYDPAAGPADRGAVDDMADRLSHRGPDASSSWASADGRCAIGFRRLAVIDPAGSRQPASTPDDRYTLAFNGEVYNFNRLRESLAATGVMFNTRGDTEVLLHWLAMRGTEAVGEVDGMFALALYDGRDSRLTLLRDRLGQKPLWWADTGSSVLFASEAKALLAWEGVDRRLDQQSIVLYMAMGYVPAPRSAWKGLSKLPPAGLLEVRAECGPGEMRTYWQIEAGQRPDLDLSTPEAGVRGALRRAVQQRLVADVPLGLLLSGGIDSAATAVLMREILGAGATIRSFTASFSDDSLYDDTALAGLVADRLGLEHTVLPIGPPCRDDLIATAEHFDEPFSDSSAIPTWQVCRAARQHVTVALTGDGGDEAFAGYDRHRAMHIAARLKPHQYALFRLAGKLAVPFAGRHERGRLRRLIRFADGLPNPPAMQYLLYRTLFTWSDLQRVFCPAFLGDWQEDLLAEWFCGVYASAGEAVDELQAVQVHDIRTYLPDDLLVKADISSMASSLELRSPFLDHRVMQQGLSLPAELKVSRRRGKEILRRAFAEDLPEQVVAARKRGFGVPMARWFREDLAEVLQETLLDEAFLNAGIIQPEATVGLLNDHLSGRQDYHHRLWSLWVLARWLDDQGQL